ncbi:MAG: DUF559 domain-containing protein [Phycisphaerales bacterium]|nr:DUF559 domain-containing protein [Phycisphaerales bacterium]
MSDSQDIQRARQLRQDQTPPEGVLWSRLRDRRLGGIKFRRQHPVGPYTLDFFCMQAMLAVEVDGAMHGVAGARRHDDARDVFLRSEGIEVLRIPVREIVTNMDGVLVAILDRTKRRIAER